MAKRRFKKTRRTGRRFAKFRKRITRPSIVDTIGFAAPQIMSMMGGDGIGYNVTDPVMSGDFKTAATRALANEVLLFTGYDMIGRGWSWKAPLMNYGLMLAMPKIVKKIAPNKRVNIPMVGTIKVT